MAAAGSRAAVQRLRCAALRCSEGCARTHWQKRAPPAPPRPPPPSPIAPSALPPPAGPAGGLADGCARRRWRREAPGCGASPLSPRPHLLLLLWGRGWLLPPALARLPVHPLQQARVSVRVLARPRPAAHPAAPCALCCAAVLLLQDIAVPVTQAVLGRAGSQFFLVDRDEAPSSSSSTLSGSASSGGCGSGERRRPNKRPPLLCRLSQDRPDEVSGAAAGRSWWGRECERGSGVNANVVVQTAAAFSLLTGARHNHLAPTPTPQLAVPLPGPPPCPTPMLATPAGPALPLGPRRL